MTDATPWATHEEQVEQLLKERMELRERLFELRKQRPPEPVEDFVFTDHDGGSVPLSELFGGKPDLILVHNMGTRCPMCTLWADGLNGIAHHLADRAAFVVVSPDAVDVQKPFKESRGWTFRMLSADGTTFFADMGFAAEKFPALPGVSTFQKREDGTVVRVGKDYFGPHDPYCALFPLMDLFPEGQNDWWPKLAY